MRALNNSECSGEQPITHLHYPRIHTGCHQARKWDFDCFDLQRSTSKCTLMVKNIPHMQQHHHRKHRQYQIIITQFVTGPVTAPALLFNITTCVPPRATLLAQPRFVLYTVWLLAMHRGGGVLCALLLQTNNGHRKDQGREIPNDSIFISPQQRVRAQQRRCTCGASGALQTSQDKQTLSSCRGSGQVRTGPLNTLCRCTWLRMSDFNCQIFC